MLRQEVGKLLAALSISEEFAQDTMMYTETIVTMAVAQQQPAKAEDTRDRVSRGVVPGVSIGKGLGASSRMPADLADLHTNSE